jgi:hypothetical protein
MNAGSLAVAEVSRDIAQDQIAWAKEQDTANRETLQQVLDIQLPAMRDQARAAQEDRARYETTFRPLEDKFVEEAQAYDTPERRDAERGRAIADVTSQFDAQRRNALQRLESYGVDPSQTRNAALDVGVRTAQAATAAGAASQSDQRVESVGRGLRGDVINLGRGALSGVGPAYAGAVGAGQAAIGGANQTTATSAGAMGSAAPFLNSALGGYGQSAGIQNMGYQNQLAGWETQQANKAGAIQGAVSLGALALMMRDGAKIRGRTALPPGDMPYMDDGMVDTGMGDGSGIDDTVPAMVSDGEYVIPADVVRIKGEEFFDKLVAKYHIPAAQQEAGV